MSRWVGTKETCDNEHIKKLYEVPQHEQRSEEWFEQRKHMLTSSNAGAALGLVKQKSPDQVVLDYCGAGKPFVGNIATQHGQYWEDPAIDYYCASMNYRNYNFGLLPFYWKERDDVILDENGNEIDLSFIGGSVDGMVQDLNDPQGPPRVIEVKCPWRRKIVMGKCPEYYYPQVQLNMFITDVWEADFFEYEPGREEKEKINIVRCYRDQRWLEKNIPIMRKVWDQVLYYREHGIENHPKMMKKKKKVLTLPAPQEKEECMIRPDH